MGSRSRYWPRVLKTLTVTFDGGGINSNPLDTDYGQLRTSIRMQQRDSFQ